MSVVPTWSLLHENHPGLCRDVGSGDEHLLASVHGAADRTEAFHLRKLLARALGCNTTLFCE